MPSPLDLSWGEVTPELVDDASGIALHVINHNLATPHDVAINVAFLRSRVRWFRRHLPRGWAQWVRFDDRGQDLSESTRQSLRANVPGVERFTFVSEGSS